MVDPFGPSTDPDIPTPTEADLLPHLHGSVRHQLASGILDAKQAENEWAGARRKWDEGHKREAERRRAEEDSPTVTEYPEEQAQGAVEVANEHAKKEREEPSVKNQKVSERGSHDRPTEPPRTQEVEDIPLSLREKKAEDIPLELSDKADSEMPRDDESRLSQNGPTKKSSRNEVVIHVDAGQLDQSGDPMEKYLANERKRQEETISRIQPPHRPLQTHDVEEAVERGVRRAAAGADLQDGLEGFSSSLGFKPLSASNEKVKTQSWIHRIPVWKEFGPWLKWASACFAFAATMTQVSEYLLAEVGLVACGICCIVQIYVWTFSQKRKPIVKLTLALLSVGLMTVAALTVYKIKDDKPWSNWLIVKSAPPQVPQKPDVVLRFVSPHNPALVIANQSDVVARNIKWAVVLWNLNLPDRLDPLPIPVQTFDFVRGHSQGGSQNLFDGPLVTPLRKKGDVLVGSAVVDCPDCARGRSYFLHIEWGQSGWFAELENETTGRLLVPQPLDRRTLKAYFDEVAKSFPASARKPIVDF